MHGRTRVQGESQQGCELCRKQFAFWVRNQFHLPHDVNVGTVYRIVKHGFNIIEYSNFGLVNKMIFMFCTKSKS